MNLADFIASPYRNEWIEEPGLAYYVRKSLMFPGLIELANCHAADDSFGYWRFLKRYEAIVPFIAEQVLNKQLAKLYALRHWMVRFVGDTPQYMSPLAVDQYRDTERFKLLWESFQ